MALLSVNAAGGEQGHEPAEAGTLDAALDLLPEGRPVIVLIHGFRFSPYAPGTDPHGHIFSFEPTRECWKAISWPRHLHLDRPGAGLGIGFGWPANGALPRVSARAHDAGACLSRMLRKIRACRPDAPLQIMAHSLGARVALTALCAAPERAVQRMILLSGAEYRSAARKALTTPAAAGCEVLNVTSGENALFDLMFRLAVPAGSLSDKPLSAGLPELARWTDLRIDRAVERNALAALGHRIRPPATRICHWSGYMRPGIFGVYRRMLDPEDGAFPGRLRAALADAAIRNAAADCPDTAPHAARA
jgi:pimeloyl-ACP methyl ester carboxylesterase